MLRYFTLRYFDAGATKNDKTMNTARNFREYKVWQDAVEFVTLVYQISSQFPWFEKKGLCDQLQRASVSIPSNIAEGSGRPTNADFAHFLDMALGSSYEVETQLLITKNVGYIDDSCYISLHGDIIKIERQLIALIRSIRNDNSR